VKAETAFYRSYRTYKTYVEAGSPETAANTLLCLIHQANYLLEISVVAAGFSLRRFPARSDRPADAR